MIDIITVNPIIEEEVIENIDSTINYDEVLLFGLQTS